MGKQSMRNLLVRYRRAVICVTALGAVVFVPSLPFDAARAQEAFTHPTAKPAVRKKMRRSKAPATKQKRTPNRAAKNKVFSNAAQNTAPLVAPAPTSSEEKNVGEFQPVLHARTAKLASCMDQVVTQSNSVIDSPHTAISSWSKTRPNENFFRSLIGLSSHYTTVGWLRVAVCDLGKDSFI